MFAPNKLLERGQTLPMPLTCFCWGHAGMSVGINQPFTSPVVGGVAFTNTPVPFFMTHGWEKPGISLSTDFTCSLPVAQELFQKHVCVRNDKNSLLLYVVAFLADQGFLVHPKKQFWGCMFLPISFRVPPSPGSVLHLQSVVWRISGCIQWFERKR